MRVFSPFFVLIFVLAIAAPAAAQGKNDAGQKVFADNKCSVCHSIAGVGNKKFPLDEVGKHNAEYIKGYLTDAKAAAEKEGKKLALPMKSFKTLPPADFDALVAYLLTLK
ncbi:MAG TPA: cytochrome c [Vicinamibacterales bacterium]|nr:cytochrome c [Vicinamibacterales bacterium]